MDVNCFNEIPVLSKSFAFKEDCFEKLLISGGMPVVHDPEISKEEALEWSNNYQRIYLERDVTDLARLKDLEPFVLTQKASALRTGNVINFSDIARSASISPETAKRFIRYLELSYQVILLKPYFRNLEKRLSKMPKLHFLDSGVFRSIMNRKGSASGNEFESVVVAEIFKQIKNADLKIEFFHLRTNDGREVDLLLELENGFVAIEIKMSDKVSPVDARHLKGLQDILDKPHLASIVLSMDREIKLLGEKIWALPAAWALSPAEIHH
jgi:predicted AAA+ superfamily ATPase